MATKKKIQYNDYAEYLKSDKWRDVKVEYSQKENTDNCLCCQVNFDDMNIIPNFHHFRYPKDWNKDSWENLIIVCECCHEELHEEFSHNSDPITLREYFSCIRWIVARDTRIGTQEYFANIMWEECAGRFSIVQKGISLDKSIALEVETSNTCIIDHFERMRDEELKKGKK